MKDKNSFIFYHDWKELIEMLEPEQVKELILAMIAVSEETELPEMDKMTQTAFISIRQAMERDIKRYKERCEKNRQAAETRWSNQQNQ